MEWMLPEKENRPSSSKSSGISNIALGENQTSIPIRKGQQKTYHSHLIATIIILSIVHS